MTVQFAILMTIALTGLGCHNKSCETTTPQRLYSSGVAMPSYALPHIGYANPVGYIGYPLAPEADLAWDPYPTHWDSIQSTLFSLVLGHDLSAPTRREIEASAYGGVGPR
jgi:hypothetical protein